MKQPIRLSVIALAMTALLSACNDKQPAMTTTPEAADTSTVLATVNGTPITQKVYDDFVAQIDLQPGIAQQQVLTELVTRTLVIKDAEKRGLQNEASFLRQLNGARENLLLRSALESVGTQPPVAEAELQKAYDAQVMSVSGNEYKARHILLEDEAKALAVIAKLEQGADFAELAKSDSTGPSSSSGGDLGWFSPDQMVPPFSEAVIAMKKGEFTKAPVKTQFGYHVIQLEDSRSLTPPSLEEVKPQLQQQVQQLRVRDYIESLRSSASIEMMVETEKENDSTNDKQ